MRWLWFGTRLGNSGRMVGKRRAIIVSREFGTEPAILGRFIASGTSPFACHRLFARLPALPSDVAQQLLPSRPR